MKSKKITGPTSSKKFSGHPNQQSVSDSHSQIIRDEIHVAELIMLICSILSVVGILVFLIHNLVDFMQNRTQIQIKPPF